MPPFNVKDAMAAGYSEDEIVDYLAKKNNFNVPDAKKSGYSSAEILSHLLSKRPEPPPDPKRDLSFGEGLMQAYNPISESGDVKGTIDASRSMAQGISGTAIGMLPIAGVANAAGYSPEYTDNDWFAPSGIKEGPSIIENVAEGNIGQAALQGVGLIPDVGYGIKAVSALSSRPAKVGLTSLETSAPLNKGAQKALDELKAALKASGMSTDEAVDYVKNLGDSAVPADLPAFAALNRTVSTTPGESALAASKFLTERGAKEPTRNRLADIVRKTFNKNPEEFSASRAFLETKRTGKSDPLYKRGIDNTIDFDSPLLRRILKDKEYQSAAKNSIESQKSINIENPSSASPIFKTIVGRPPSRAVKATKTTPAIAAVDKVDDIEIPTFQTLHDVQSQLGREISALKVPAIPGGKITGDVRLQIKAKRAIQKSITKMLDASSESYKKAGEIYKKQSDLISALDKGAEFSRRPLDEIVRIMKPMTLSQKELYRYGVAKSLDDMAARNPTAFLEMVKKPKQLDKLRKILPTTKSFEDFTSGIDNEIVKRTTLKSSGAKDAAIITGQDVSKIGNENPVAAVAGDVAANSINPNSITFGRTALRRIGSAFSSNPKPTTEELAKFLYSKDQSAIDAVADRLRGDELIRNMKANRFKQKVATQ